MNPPAAGPHAFSMECTCRHDLIGEGGRNHRRSEHMDRRTFAFFLYHKIKGNGFLYCKRVCSNSFSGYDVRVAMVSAAHGPVQAAHRRAGVCETSSQPTVGSSSPSPESSGPLGKLESLLCRPRCHLTSSSCFSFQPVGGGTWQEEACATIW